MVSNRPKFLRLVGWIPREPMPDAMELDCMAERIRLRLQNEPHRDAVIDVDGSWWERSPEAIDQAITEYRDRLQGA